jgi:putative cardiolipin synthase
VVDRQQVFVGSMNMDQRSKLLNTEMGIIVDSSALAQAVRQFFDTASSPANAYRVSLAGEGLPHAGRMQWRARDGSKTITCTHDPGTTAKQRLEVVLLKWLPIQGLL